MRAHNHHHCHYPLLKYTNCVHAHRRFLQRQQLRDGDLVIGAGPGVNPVHIVEDIADILLEELLGEQAAGVCVR